MPDLPRQTTSLGRYSTLIDATLARADRENFIPRIWAKDASLWKSDEANQQIIRNALGWLTVPQWTSERVPELEALAREVNDTKFQYLMLLGMGGSSLCPEVFRRTFGKREGFPELLVLDTTDADTIADFEFRADQCALMLQMSYKLE
jgi:hypothetical protein